MNTINITNLSPLLSEGVQTILLKLGFTWGSLRDAVIRNTNRELIQLDLKDRIMWLPGAAAVDATFDATRELGRIIEVCGPASIKVNEHVVEFKENGIQVGCTFVPTETVDAIHARLHKKD